MRKRYSEEFKESVIQKMMPPNPVPISQLVQETGVCEATLYKWRTDYRNRGIAVPVDNPDPAQWTAADKLAVVIETAALNEAELSGYCRTKGLYPEQVSEWKTAALSGYERTEQGEKAQRRNRQVDQKTIKRLETELRRKDKALAETAALLVLSKKCEAIWGESEAD